MRELNEVLRDLKRGVRCIKDSRNTYDIAEAYYDGDDPELYLSDALRLYLRDSVSAFRLNMASVAVDAVSDRLFISAITSPDESTQAEIDKILADNDFWAWSNDAIRESEKLGDDYIGVWVGLDKRPVLSPLDPRDTRVIYDSELERIPEYLIRFWKENEGVQDEEFERATISYPDEIYKFYRDSGGTEWEPFAVDGESWPLKNIVGDLPVGHLRNGFPYGSPGHRKSYGMQQVITKSILNMVANIDFMGFRQRYAVKNPDQMQAQGVPSPSPRSNGGEAVGATGVKPALTAGPGKLWQIVAESVGEFSPTESKEFIDLISSCIVNMARAERMSVRKYGMDGSGQAPSAESQREDDKSFQDRVNAGKRSRAGGLVSMMTKALKVVNPTKNWGPVEVEWERQEVNTDKTEYEIAGLAAALIVQVNDFPYLRPFCVQKFQEWGYSMQEIESFLPEEPVSTPSDVAVAAPSELDSANQE